MGDYVLVHRSRFPQWPAKKLSPPYFGPFKILFVKPSSLTIKVSPFLGSEIEVSFGHLKRFPSCSPLSDSGSDDEDVPESTPEGVPDVPPAPLNPAVLPVSPCPAGDFTPSPAILEPFTEEKAKIHGFYNVDCILSHKMRQGWRFLTKWEGYDTTEATWEGVKAFVHPDGTLNDVFVTYCQTNSLFAPLQQALTRALRAQN